MSAILDLFSYVTHNNKYGRTTRTARKNHKAESGVVNVFSKSRIKWLLFRILSPTHCTRHNGYPPTIILCCWLSDSESQWIGGGKTRCLLVCQHDNSRTR